jgi:endo-1,4-beta-D-glucanase Y
MKNRVILVVLFLLSGSYLLGQNRPFPQSEHDYDYPYGYTTTVIPSDSVLSMYDSWKGLFLVSCPGPNDYLRVRVSTDANAHTRSEGMGYGMLLSAYFGERGVFDSLFAFYNARRTSQALNLMAWDVTCSGAADPGSATDGDIDAAFGLIVAYYQWDEVAYRDSAKSILSILKNYYFVDDCGGGYVLHPGYNGNTGGYWGGCDLTDLSYYMPAFFRVFAQVTGEPFWDTVADDAYEILDSSADPTTGLVPDWQSWDGIPGGTYSERDSIYHYDACRVPWRIGLDYIWYGDSRAQSWCYKISDFADSIGPSHIVDGYDLNGDSLGEWNNGSFVGGFAVGGMCHSQAMVDSFASRLLWLDQQGWDDTYYNLTLKCLYALVLTGNFWDPLAPVGIDEPDYLLEGLSLKQNYPNPFHAATTIEYSTGEPGFVKLAIYDVSGREIKTLVEKFVPAGKYTVDVELKDLCPGVYVYRLEKSGNSIQKKMILVR